MSNRVSVQNTAGTAFAAINIHRANIGMGALAASWLTLIASDVGWLPWQLHQIIHEDILMMLAASTTVLVLVLTLRGPSYLSALRLGRQIERQRQRGRSGGDMATRLEEITMPTVELPPRSMHAN